MAAAISDVSCCQVSGTGLSLARVSCGITIGPVRFRIDEDHVRQSLRGGRVFWIVLAGFEAVNALDWLTTVVGVGLLGLREQNPTALGLMERFGVFWGTTLHKGLVGILYIPVALLGAWMARSRHTAHLAVWFVWVIGVATGVMAQVVLVNIASILGALLSR
jgi:hypothetical protein